MRMTVPKIRHLFAAAAIAVGVTALPTPADAFGIGSQSGGSGGVTTTLELEDNTGQEYTITLPDQDDPRFKSMALEIMTAYVGWKNLQAIGDYQAAGFLMVVRILADYSGMSAEDYAAEIALNRDLYADLLFRQERYAALSRYNSIIAAAYQSDPWYANQSLEYGNGHLREANESLAQAAAKYPAESSFKIRSLTDEDLIKIRRNAARVNVKYLLDLFASIDSGALDERMLGQDITARLDNMGDLLYRDIQMATGSARNEWDNVAGNDYNRLIPDLMDEELNRRGVNRDRFYERFVSLRNYYVRYEQLPPVPPPVPAPLTQP